MSQEIDRIQVPTNGKGPHPVAAPPAPEDEAEAVQNQAEAAATGAFSPTQLAVGFGILASLAVLAVGWMRRRNRSGSGGGFGRR